MSEITTHTDSSPNRNSEIGTTLRRRREALDLELTDVASILRIRREYLVALENNTLVGLPGPAYALGFLRTYADYLGLDSADMVRRYKASTDALNDKPSLTFPMPLTPRGVPGGGLFLLTTIVLIGLGYGTWYYISSGQHQSLSTVEPVPPQLTAIAPPPPPAAAPSAAPATAPAPAAGTAAAPHPAAPTVPNPVAPGLPSSTSAAQPAPPAAPQAQPATPALVQVTPPAAAAGALPPANPAADLPPETSLPAATADATPAAPDASQTQLGGADSEPPTPAQTAPVAATPAATTKATGPVHVYGQPKAARVVITATAVSWIQVRDETGNVLTQRTLKPGDIYNAPDRKGLVMRAGNAGALQVSVDGHAAPPIGSFGQVRQRIDLDPASLSHGAAQ